MAGAPREFLYIVEESAYKTPVATPVVWTTATTFGLANATGYCMRLDADNSFDMRPVPAGTVTVMYGGGKATPAYMVSDKQELKGKLSVKLCVGQSPFLLSWAAQFINSGQTAPWVTTEPVGDLASCTIYHAITRPDGTIKRRAYLGVKVASWTLVITESATVAQLTLNLVGSTPQGNQFDSSTDPTAGTFPVPADIDLPIDPYVFLHAGGTSFFTYAGAVRTQMTDLTITSTNVLASRFYAQRYIPALHCFGRTTTLATRLLYPLAAQDDRTLFEGLNVEASSLELNNGTHGMTIGFNAQNVLSPFNDELATNDLYLQSSTSNNLWDPSAGSDLSLAFA